MILSREQVEAWREELLSDPKTIPSDDDRGKVDQLCDQALSALAPVSVPEGWRMVPVECPDAMMHAGVDAGSAANPPHWKGAGRPGYTQVRAIWDAMLSAAPTVSQGEGGWISVGDRLPEPETVDKKTADFVPVLYVINGQTICAGRFLTGKKKYRWRSLQGLESTDADVTHWQPLPAPPLEAKREGGEGYVDPDDTSWHSDQSGGPK